MNLTATVGSHGTDGASTVGDSASSSGSPERKGGGKREGSRGLAGEGEPIYGVRPLDLGVRGTLSKCRWPGLFLTVRTL